MVIASVDADEHKSLGGRFDVKGFPTLLWFPKGGDASSPEKYEGGRTADALIEWINGKVSEEIPERERSERSERSERDQRERSEGE